MVTGLSTKHWKFANFFEDWLFQMTSFIIQVV